MNWTLQHSLRVSEVATNTEKIEDLQKVTTELREVVATLTTRLDSLWGDSKALHPEISANGKVLEGISAKVNTLEQLSGELRIWKEGIDLSLVRQEIAKLQERLNAYADQQKAFGLIDMHKQVAVLEDRVQTLQKAAENSLSRWWALWTALGAAIVSSGITGVATYYIMQP